MFKIIREIRSPGWGNFTSREILNVQCESKDQALIHMLNRMDPFLDPNQHQWYKPKPYRCNGSKE